MSMANQRVGAFNASPFGTPDVGIPAVRTLTTAGAGALTADHLAGGFLRRSGPAAPYADTLPSAESLRAILAGASDAGKLLPGNSFKWIYSKGVAFAMTITRGAGWILGSNVDLNSAATGAREYLVQCLNATPAQVYLLSTTNANAVITGFTADQMKTLSVGMCIEHANFATGTRIISMDFANNTVTASANASATTANTAITFSPVFQLEGLFSSSI